MHRRSLSELQGVSTQQEASTRRTAQKQVTILGSTSPAGPLLRSSRPRRGSGCRLCPSRGALLWAWLLLAALAVPGAWSSLSEEEEELIVELHNHYRGQVSPSASAMLPLKWDSNLKVIAEGYAAKCIWNHNPDLEETGENLFVGTGTLDLRVALEKWFLEHLDFDYHNNSCPEDKMCGHYTQMVWADTHRVGCAFHICDTMEGLDFEKASFLVCNYYPAGNYEEEKPYEEGDWCSRCPDNLLKCENNLCVADTVEEEEDEEDDGVEGVEEDIVDETVRPPPATTDSFLQPATTTPRPPQTTRTASSDQDSDDSEHPASPPPATPPPALLPPAPGTSAPNIPDLTQGEEKGQQEEKAVEKENEEKKVEEKGEEKEEKGKGKTDDTKQGENEREENESARMNSGLSLSPSSLLLFCLTGILILRL